MPQCSHYNKQKISRDHIPRTVTNITCSSKPPDSVAAIAVRQLQLYCGGGGASRDDL